MADYALFAEFLVNKAKLKPLSKGEKAAGVAQEAKAMTFTLDDDYVVASTPSNPTSFHQIFDECVENCENSGKQPELFREFLAVELPPLFAKFDKQCQGKHD